MKQDAATDVEIDAELYSKFPTLMQGDKVFEPHPRKVTDRFGMELFEKRTVSELKKQYGETDERGEVGKMFEELCELVAKYPCSVNCMMRANLLGETAVASFITGNTFNGPERRATWSDLERVVRRFQYASLVEELYEGEEDVLFMRTVGYGGNEIGDNRGRGKGRGKKEGGGDLGGGKEEDCAGGGEEEVRVKRVEGGGSYDEWLRKDLRKRLQKWPRASRYFAKGVVKLAEEHLPAWYKRERREWYEGMVDRYCGGRAGQHEDDTMLGHLSMMCRGICDMAFEEEMWQCASNYLARHKIDHHLLTFNDYASSMMRDVVRKHSFEIKYLESTASVQMTDCRLDRPTMPYKGRMTVPMYPRDARNMDGTYDANILVDFKVTQHGNSSGSTNPFPPSSSSISIDSTLPATVAVEPTTTTPVEMDGGDGGVEEFHLVPIGRCPVMLHSRVCRLANMNRQELYEYDEDPSDLGAYFLIHGKDKIVISQSRLGYNIPLVFPKKQPNKYQYVCEIRSFGTRAQLFEIKIATDRKSVVCSFPRLVSPIPASVLLRAMGMVADEIWAAIVTRSQMQNDEQFIDIVDDIVRDARDLSEQDAEAIIKSRMGNSQMAGRQNLERILQNECIPHMRGSRYKNWYICKLIGHLVLVSLGRRGCDDRDHYMHKRVDSSGNLMKEMFQIQIKKWIKQIQTVCQKQAFGPSLLSKQSCITQGFRYGMGSGNWTSQKSVKSKNGVTQVMNTLNPMCRLSHARRLTTPIGRESKNTTMRTLHNSQNRMVCPAETPEGPTCGIVQNFALLSQLTSYVDPVVVLNFLTNKATRLENLQGPSDLRDLVQVMVNGQWTHVCEADQAEPLVAELRQFRQKGGIHRFVSITHMQSMNEIRIWTDSSRFVRPVLVMVDVGGGDYRVAAEVEFMKGKRFRNMDDLQAASLISLIDSTESDFCNITTFSERHDESMLPSLHYCEMPDAMLFGVGACGIPFPDHNQSPRNTYQAAMGKQAMGLYYQNYLKRFDINAHVLRCIQKPLVTTNACRAMGLDDSPAGVNVIVAIALADGFNQEDSVCLNRDAIQRGLFQSDYYRTIKVEEKKPCNNYYEYIELPSLDIRAADRSYANLDEQGIIRQGSTIAVGDVIVGKVLKEKEKSTKVDVSLVAKHGDGGIVDAVLVTQNEGGWKLVKIRVRTTMIPVVGDKFSSRHGQKGTCGCMFPQSDMAFTSDGLVPDLVMNPQAVPSRMTIGQVFEGIVGKRAAAESFFFNASPFTSASRNVETLCQALVRHGYLPSGLETMYSGTTGERMRAMVFIAPTFYQRLKHLVDHKIHARAHGNITVLCRQPTEGRLRDGGLRIGEMERDCQAAHGNSGVLNERLFVSSDPYHMPVCNSCGAHSFGLQCHACGGSTTDIRIPYACKLMFQELMGLMLYPCIKPS